MLFKTAFQYGVSAMEQVSHAEVHATYENFLDSFKWQSSNNLKKQGKGESIMTLEFSTLYTRKHRSTLLNTYCTKTHKYIANNFGSKSISKPDGYSAVFDKYVLSKKCYKVCFR